MVSLYFWGLMERPQFQHQTGEKGTFAEFLTDIYNKKYIEFVGHRYINQWDWITDHKDKIRVNRILRYENLDKDFAKLLHDLGIPNFKLEKINTAKQRSGQERKHYRKYYNKEARKMIEKMFAKDLEAFNYKF
jgi:hypothetical protein